MDAEYPGYVLSTPTVVDIDGKSGAPEIIIGTSGGQLHILNALGVPHHGFPVPKDSFYGQVTLLIYNEHHRISLHIILMMSLIHCNFKTSSGIVKVFEPL